jgi:hypothetical protein
MCVLTFYVFCCKKNSAIHYHKCTQYTCRSHWPRGLRRRSAAARLLRLWFRILWPPTRRRATLCILTQVTHFPIRTVHDRRSTNFITYIRKNKQILYNNIKRRTLVANYLCVDDRLCGLVVRVSGYRYRGPGFDPWRYQIF